MRTGKFPLRILIVVLILGVGASAFWAGHASSGSPSSEVKTYQPGWANIAWLGDTAPVGAALSSIADSVGVVYYLDPDSGSWQRYIPGRPEVSTLTTMAFGKSYLLLFTKPATLEQATQPDDVCAPGGCPGPSEVACNSLYPCPLPVDIECLQALTEYQTYLAECITLLATCGAAPSQDLEEVCRLIDDLVGDSQDLDGAWGFLKMKLMIDQDYGLLDWTPTDSAVSDVGWTASSLRSWATWNCW